jgi:hypothetical protein
MSEPEYKALRLRPVTVKDDIKWCVTVHRHLRRELAGARFAVAIVDGAGNRCGVGLVTSGPRVWEGTGRCNIARIGTDGVKNGCSMLYGALCRAAQALGYREAWTYTLPSEPGTSLRAAGFDEMGMTDGGEHDRPNQPKRRRRAAEQPQPKRRWRRILVEESKWNLSASTG